MKIAAKIIVSGTVQGVFYRKFIKENADKLGLKGFVRNLENGDVEIFVEGEKEKIKELLEEAKKGPKYSLVKNVSIEEKKWTGEFKEFKILSF
ncbi:MAG: acylphosphatase [Candidatus Pacearchaeota archaeon]